MGESVDPKKLLLPYLQRADELQKHEPLVAYYCRLYAMERGLKIPAKERGKIINGLLVSLMSQLEKDKKVIKLGPEDNLYLEGFASSVFAKADKQDRAGRADLNTAKTFYAASIFFEVLHQFGEIDPELEQKQKYAVWKAADIRKALSEGRKPTPGPPGGDEEFSQVEHLTWDAEGSPKKSKFNPAAVAPEAPEFQNGSTQPPPPASENHPLPGSEPLPRTSSFESLPRPPSTTPHAPHHIRSGSADDIDLPAAPSQPIYPGNLSTSPPRYSSGFTTSYPSSQYSGQDSGALPPPIHDWSGSRSHVADTHGEPPSSSPFSHPTETHDNYNSSSANYASYPAKAPNQDATLYPTEQGNNYSQYSAPPSQYFGYHSGAYPSATPSQTAYPTDPTTQHVYPSASTHTDGSYPPPAAAPSASPGYSELSQQHQRTSSAPPVAAPTTGYSSSHYVSASSYQPTPDKVAEAHKAARFAVSALAFDDVPAAIEYLRKSMELLTSPSSQAH
ncbi:hypothetical protein R1sor_003780 [Riccia sorocarpa]|uniref:Uncharacterized protein n=1 Tax=Riccia sorocarpa TaxID=122646 RepID=A0ABD3H2L4_9MARC